MSTDPRPWNGISRFLALAALPAALCSHAAISQPLSTAQPYPSRPIQIVVPYAVGGGTDITTRIIAQKLSESMGQPVVVQNRPGGDSIIGTEFVAKSPPDGYTILAATTAFGAFPGLYSKLPFDTQRDFAPVSLVATIPLVLSVHPNVPARSVKEFIALAKSKPGALDYGSGGRSSPVELATALFQNMTNINMQAIEYKGGSLQIMALLKGEISMTFALLSGGLPHFKAGTLIPLGITTRTRNSVLPDVPTLDEAGVPGYEMFEWQGYVVPAGTPTEVIDRLNVELRRALALPDVKERLAGLGMQVHGSSTQALSEHIASEARRWKELATKGALRQ